MKMFHILLTVCYIQLTVAQIQNDTINYYERLITEEIRKAATFQLPTDSRSYMKNSSSEISDFGNFDFIVIGAGAAGSVMASRLSENSNWNVLLLEAGKPETDFSQIPITYSALQLSEMNWGYRTTPQRNCCLGFVDGRCPFVRGKALGGTTAINGLFYTRGNARDYNSWLAAGNYGWSYEDVFPYFLKSENSEINGDLGYHNVGGLVNVEYDDPPSPLLKTFINGNKELGREQVDFNGIKQLGFGRAPFNTIDGQRGSNAHFFLKPAANRANLKIVTEALVLKIGINYDTKEADHVIFISNGNFYRATVQYEIILSAGVINSPQLLMLSGVGSPEELNKNNIDVVHALPGVGKNLHEHVLFLLTIPVNYTEPVKPLKTVVNDYFLNRVQRNEQAASFMQVTDSPTWNVPDVEVMFYAPGNLNITVPGDRPYRQEVIEYYLKRVDRQSTVNLILLLLHPKSRGSIGLSSNSPFDYPSIDVNLLSHPDDFEVMYLGIQDCLKLINTTAFQEIGAKVPNYQLPSCKSFDYLSKDYWFCILRQLSETGLHGVGTCKMGPKIDPYAVVDHTLKVHGIAKLRVVDGSVIPKIVSGHTAAPITMVAEKVASTIKIEYF